MIPKPRSLRVPRNPIGLLILLAAFAAAAGCSTANTSGDGGGVVVNHVDASGNSVPGWVTPTGGTHANSATLNYIANGGSSSCTECHGSDLAGGISRVSCFNNTAGCHHGSVAGWVAIPPAAQQHGVSAKKAPGSSGFASCQICHGADFRTVRGGITCFTCHASTPHAPAPWRGSPYTHVTTDPANAPVCAQCHFTDSPNNPPNHPATPAPTGTAPGCFNNTLCHGENPVPHPVDNAWVVTSPAPQPHGNDAKAAAGDNTGFSYCQACHGSGSDFAGGSSLVSCYPCHGANAPHAPPPWRASAGSTYTHTTTVETGNADVCALCHFFGSPNNPPNHPATAPPAGTAPGCFNGTLCHASAVPHPVDNTWVTASPAAQPHGNDAKASPGDNTGFIYCQGCHGAGTSLSSFAGGSSGVSCYPCHLPTAIQPHASQWRTGDTYVHTTTAGGNAAACAFCHLNGAISPIPPPSPPAPAGTPPGCFNSTLCHGSIGGGLAHAVPFNSTAHYSVDNTTFTANCGSCHAVTGTSPVAGAPLCATCHVAASPLTALNCTSCHASPPDGGAPAGAAYANIAGAHATHIALNSTGTPVSCNTCHNGLGTNTLNHYNRAKARVAPGDVAFPATYNAQTGASSFDNSAALNCANVSCHGGQATPNWQTGSLTVNTACTNCHSSGTAQFNSYNSGDHGINSAHSNCTNCHNTTALAVNHFTALSTPAMEGPASATIGGGTTLITAGNYNPATRSCTPACHGNETW